MGANAMKKIIFLISIIPSIAFSANVPEFSHKDPIIQREFENVGFEIQKARNLPVTSTTSYIVNIGTSNSQSFSVSKGTFTAESPYIPNAILANQAAAFGQVKILQVVTSSTTVPKTTTSNSFQATDLVSTITVQNGSRVFLNASCDMQIAASNVNVFATIYAGTNRNLGNSSGLASWLNQAASTNRVPISMSVLDTTSLTAGTTNYTVRIRNSDGVSTISMPSSNTPMCTMTAFEVNGL